MSDGERRSIKGWAGRLSVEDEPLTLAEAQLLATISSADRLYEQNLTLGDIRMRLERIELFLAATVPGYEVKTRAITRALADAARETNHG